MLDQSVANTSQHLQVLKRARLVHARKDGLHVMYSLADEAVVTFYQSLRALAETQVAELGMIRERVNQGFKGMSQITPEELLLRAGAGEVSVLDVRTQAEYQAGHLPHAVHIPIEELRERLHELPPGRDVVVYCRGSYCVLSHQAVSILEENGLSGVRA
jgi:rhodanese-related sulfurtransferase